MGLTVYDRHLAIYKAWANLLSHPEANACNPTMVYTPNPVVAFQRKSCEEQTQEQYGKGLFDQGVELLDPFSGTGVYLTSTILDEEIAPLAKLLTKYDSGEMLCCEHFLPAWYITIINVELAYTTRTGEYNPFGYALLTDTFELDPIADLKQQPQPMVLDGLFAKSGHQDAEDKSGTLPLGKGGFWSSGDADSLFRKGMIDYYDSMFLAGQAEPLVDALIAFRHAIPEMVAGLVHDVPHHPYLFLPKGLPGAKPNNGYGGADISVCSDVNFIARTCGMEPEDYNRESKAIHRKMKKETPVTLGGLGIVDLCNRIYLPE